MSESTTAEGSIPSTTCVYDGRAEQLARVAYQAYGDTTEWKNFAGAPMPTWEQLPERIRHAWRNAVSAAVQAHTKPVGEALDFGGALRALREGQRLQRAGWNGKGMHIELQRPDEGSKMTLPYLFMKTAQGDLVPWLASQTDVLAADWQVV